MKQALTLFIIIFFSAIVSTGYSQVKKAPEAGTAKAPVKTLKEIFETLKKQNAKIVAGDAGKATFTIEAFPADKQKDVEIFKGNEGEVEPTSGNMVNGNLVFDLAADAEVLSKTTFTLKDKTDATNRYIIPGAVSKSGDEVPKLPPSKLDIISSAFATNSVKPCDDCGPGDVIYDNINNTFTKNSWGKVGKPFIFQIKNLNPFRDSAIISYATMDYNTEGVAAIMSKFDPTNAAKLANRVTPVAQNCDQLLADVLSLGSQITTIKQMLSGLKECDDLCDKVKAVVDKTNGFFANSPYNYNAAGNQSLEQFLFQQLAACTSIDAKQLEIAKTAVIDYYYFRTIKTYFNYRIPKLQNVDEYIFNISVLPKKGIVSNYIIDHQPVSVPLTDGFKVDASTGLFATRLTNQNFTLKDSAGRSETIKQIIPQDNGKWDFGVSALMHFYPRISPDFNIGASAGVGVSIGPNPAIRYLSGLSLLIGRSPRFALTFGTTMGFVNRLAEGYNANDYVRAASKDDIIKKVFRAKNFWSITFNVPLFKSTVNTATETAATKAADTEEKSDTKTEGKPES